ncbi:MAG: DUF2927 domain-containing protein, partial [Verrucomicrobiota bacterium]
MKFILGIALVTLLLCHGAVAQSSLEKDLEWARTICMGAEYNDKERVARQWTSSPKLAIHYASNAEAAIIKDTVRHINSSVGDHKIGKIEIVPASNKTADIRIYFGPLEDFGKMHKKYANVTYPKGNWGTFWYWYDGGDRLNRGVVFLSNKLSDNKRWIRHFALEEITQVLGFANDSSIYSDSVFYSNPKKNSHGTTQKLS